MWRHWAHTLQGEVYVMEINHIREFLILVSAGNYLDAAQELYTSIASLGRHMKKLEDELGFELFVMKGRNAELSEQAEVFLPYARTLVETQEQCFNAVEFFRSGAKDRLRLGMISLESPSYHLFDYIAAFAGIHPDIIMDTYEQETRVLCRMLAEDKLDMVFAYFPEEYRDRFHGVMIEQDTLAYLVPERDPLSAVKSVSITEIAARKLIPRPRRGYLNDFIFGILERYNTAYTLTSYPSSTASLFSMIRNGLGATLIPKKAAQYQLEHTYGRGDICLLDIEEETTLPVWLLYRKDQPLSPSGKRFIRFVKEKALSGSENSGRELE